MEFAMSRAIPSWFRFVFVKPILAWLLLFSLLLTGGISLQSLKQENYPDLEIPQAIVSVLWPGASPSLVENRITTPLEKHLRSLEGVKEVYSTSKNSISILSIRFRVDVSLSKAMQRLRSKVSEAQALFPKKAKKANIEQLSVNDIPIQTWVVSSTTSEKQTERLLKDLKKRLEKETGVRKVSMFGQRESIVQVSLLPYRLRQLGLSPLQVYEKLRSSNVGFPLGFLQQNSSTQALSLKARFQQAGQLKQLPVVQHKNGHITRLRDVALVRTKLSPKDNLVLFSDKGQSFRHVVSFSIYKRAGKDTIRLSERLNHSIQRISRQPRFSKLHFSLIQADANQIRDSIRNVLSNGWQSMLIVFVVLLLLLNWREALIAALSIPLTFAGVLALLYLLGFSLNQMVIIGMVLALGMLVDVFILVMEGMHEGMVVHKLSFSQAAFDTVRKFALPAFAGQSTTIFAMFPLLMVGGVDGKFIRLIPMTVILSLLLSFLIAFLLSIPLSQYLLKPSDSEQPMLVDRLTQTLSLRFGAWLKTYVFSSRRRVWLWLGGAALFFALSFVPIGSMPFILYPKADGRNLGITVSLEFGTPLKTTQKLAREVGEVLRKEPTMSNVLMYVGNKSPMMMSELSDQLTVVDGSHLLGFSCLLLPRKQRKKLGYQLVPALKQKLLKILSKVPGAKLSMRIDAGGSSNEAPLQVVLTGDSLVKLKQTSKKIQQQLRKLSMTYGVRDNLGRTQNEMVLKPRRSATARYNISTSQLGLYLNLLFDNIKVKQLQGKNGQKGLDIYLKTEWGHRTRTKPTWSQIQEVGFLAPGLPIPLSSLVLLREITSLPNIVHKNGQRSIVVQGFLKEGHTLEQVYQQLQPWLQKQRWDGVHYSWAGEKATSKEVYGSMLKALMVAIFLVFAILALLFGSFRQPWIILASVVMAFAGTMFGLFFLGMGLSFPAMIGVVSLTGIVVNDSIVMVEVMNEAYEEGDDLQTAAIRGASERLRPIVSTTLTTVLGMLPLAFSDPMWMPLCMAIVTGLSFATFSCLIVIPALFYLLGRAPETAEA
jgi:multidrug efflux pump subunit AcrB